MNISVHESQRAIDIVVRIRKRSGYSFVGAITKANDALTDAAYGAAFAPPRAMKSLRRLMMIQ